MLANSPTCTMDILIILPIITMMIIMMMVKSVMMMMVLVVTMVDNVWTDMKARSAPVKLLIAVLQPEKH